MGNHCLCAFNGVMNRSKEGKTRYFRNCEGAKRWLSHIMRMLEEDDRIFLAFPHLTAATCNGVVEIEEWIN